MTRKQLHMMTEPVKQCKRMRQGRLDTSTIELDIGWLGQYLNVLHINMTQTQRKFNSLQVWIYLFFLSFITIQIINENLLETQAVQPGYPNPYTTIKHPNKTWQPLISQTKQLINDTSIETTQTIVIPICYLHTSSMKHATNA